MSPGWFNPTKLTLYLHTGDLRNEICVHFPQNMPSNATLEHLISHNHFCSLHNSLAPGIIEKLAICHCQDVTPLAHYISICLTNGKDLHVMDSLLPGLPIIPCIIVNTNQKTTRSLQRRHTSCTFRRTVCRLN